jgi:BCD family chlorophyll transporter-like MFS transporter
VSKRSVAQWGAWGALSGFVLITLSGLVSSQSLFYSGVVLLGVGTGLATVSNLSLMLDMTTAGNVGLYIGAWGMANAFSRLAGNVLAGVVRDSAAQVVQRPVFGYLVVFVIEVMLLLISLWLLGQIDVGRFRQRAEKMNLLERSALANDG